MEVDIHFLIQNSALFESKVETNQIANFRAFYGYIDFGLLICKAKQSLRNQIKEAMI